MKRIRSLFVAAVVLLMPAAAFAASPYLTPATPGGSKQVEALGSNYVALLGLSTNANDGPFTESQFLESFLTSDQGRIVNWYYEAPSGGGAWDGNPAPGTAITFPAGIDTVSSTSGNGKLFDSLWVEFTGTSDLNFVNPDGIGGTNVISGGEIINTIGSQQFPGQTDVPVPATLVMFALGLAALFGVGCRRACGRLGRLVPLA